MLKTRSLSGYPSGNIWHYHEFLDKLENSQFGAVHRFEQSVSTSESEHMRNPFTAAVTTKSLFFL